MPFSWQDDLRNIQHSISRIYDYSDIAGGSDTQRVP